ncbi:MAG: hypothetical protein KGI58_02565 [Patescibacteria group bacterium]|nr:hypothetical protein [Patescibacteria group bacterium]
MKTKTKNYWIIIVLVIIANILIFSFFSKHLESLVTSYAIDSQSASGL